MTRLAALFIALTISAHAATEADVIVYGATPGWILRSHRCGS
jgi:hypothetical protein